MIYIIAELGINHNGLVSLAHQMIDEAKYAGVDAVKIQSYRTDDFLAPDHPDYDMFETCEIWPYLKELRDHAWKIGLAFGSTPTSTQGVAELASLRCDFLKNGSDYLLRHDVIRLMADTAIHTIVSVGMATEDEIRAAATLLRRGRARYTLMHCTSSYPCPDKDANLLRIPKLRQFGPFAGFSDHTEGLEASLAAVALGAEVIEKHFTLDNALVGPDHRFSLNPVEMLQFVRGIRRVEKMMGSSEFGPAVSEIEAREKWRVLTGSKRAA